MWLKLPLYFLIAFVLLVLQRSFFPYLPLGLAYMNFVLVILVFILTLFGAQNALYWFVGMGWLLDIFSFNFFGFNSVAFLVIFVAVYYLLTGFITDRSLYSYIMLIAVSTIMYDVITALPVADWSSWSGFFSNYNGYYWLTELKRILANTVLTFVLYQFFHVVTKRIEPVFLRDFKKY